MGNKLELARQSLSLLCKEENKLENKFIKEIGLEFAHAINKMSLAKNIKLVTGTINVWEECLIEDIRKGVVAFDDFLEATRKIIREPLYNRIDYADIYCRAIDICKNRRMKGIKSNQPQEKTKGTMPMPQEVKDMLKNVGETI